jgi:hypothetical protein
VKKARKKTNVKTNLKSQIVASSSIISSERIERRILSIRGLKVMLSPDLADLYEVEVGQLNRAVSRNLSRFPGDFMFQLTHEEHENLKCQFGISRSWGGPRHPPYAFTEQGVAMLSSVLRSPRAVQVNIAIMRAFVKQRERFSPPIATWPGGWTRWKAIMTSSSRLFSTPSAS